MSLCDWSSDVCSSDLGVRDNAKYSPDTLYALDYIIKTSPVKLFSFEVKDEILNQLVSIGKDTVRYNIDIPLKSAEILDTI